MDKLKIQLSCLLLLVLLLVCNQGILADSITAREIIIKADQNNSFRSVYSEVRMEITLGGRTITRTMRTWSEGNEKSLVEMTSKRDLGNRVLRMGDNIWIYSPSAESEVLLSGDMLKQSMMGSDFSYQDILESVRTVELYNINLIGEETLGERPCYVLDLVAKDGVEVNYYHRKVWVDQERFVYLKVEMYAPSGRLLKVSLVEEVEKFDPRYYPIKTIMTDKLRKNSSTRIIIEKIRFNPEIPVEIFTKQRLTGR